MKESEVMAWMPMFWGDYLRDTAHLTAAEHGAYLLLIAHYWVTRSPLPADDEKLRRIARMERAEWRKSKATIMAFFQPDDDGWRHKRVEAELASSGEKKAAAKDKASHAARKRWAKHGASNFVTTSNSSSMHQALLEECPPPSPSQNRDSPEAVVKIAASERDCGPDFVGDVLSVPGSIVDRWSELFPAHPDVRADLATIDATLAVSCLGKTQAELQRRAMGMLRKRHEDELRAERGRSQRVENGDGLWGGRVADWRSCGFWEPSWGPPPDMPGFLGPDSLSAAPPRAVRRGGAA